MGILKETVLVIINLEMEFEHVVEYIRKVRMCGYTAGILFLSETRKQYQKMEEKIKAIDAGVDEYLGYPQTNEEIAASVKALLRHYRRKEELEFWIGGNRFLVNPQGRKIIMDSIELTFTKTEYSIFRYLLVCLNRSVTYKELYEAVWKKE